MTIDVRNLRSTLPHYDTPELRTEWLAALEVLESVGELGVPCAMGLETRRILFQCIRAMGARRVLDIGTYCGASALLFALAVGEGGSVVSVDLHDAHGPDAWWVKAGRPRSPRALLEMAGVEDRVRFVTCDSVDYLRETPHTFDLVSIDGWHEHFHVYEEIPLALRRLHPEGLIFMDDVQPEGFVPPTGIDVIDGPRRALQRHLAEGAPLYPRYITHGLGGSYTTVAFLTKAV